MTDVMINNAVLDKILSRTRSAVSDGLLSDVDSLAAGIETAGWVRAVDGGCWYCPGEPAWSLLSSDHAPNLAVFLTDEDTATVFPTGRELTRLLDRVEGLHRYGSDPGLPARSQDNPRWKERTRFGSDWLMWEGGPARISLNIQSAYQPKGHRSPPHLHFHIEPLEVPLGTLPMDPYRARRIASSGSAIARWYLAGEVDLSEHVLDTLRCDSDPTVVAAVESGANFRTLHVAAQEHARDREGH